MVPSMVGVAEVQNIASRRVLEKCGFALERQVIHQGEDRVVFRRMDHAREYFHRRRERPAFDRSLSPAYRAAIPFTCANRPRRLRGRLVTGASVFVG